MNIFKRLWYRISDPFISVAVLIDESRRINEDGSWDKYWERKNRKEMKKEERRKKRCHGRVIR